MLFVYLDEFGHIGPFIDRRHSRHNDSPVFGLAGFAIPADSARHFGTWFFEKKYQMLGAEIELSGKHPWEWEKKGVSLYRSKSLHRYSWLRHFTLRLFSKIQGLDGFIFYYGIEKTATLDEHNPIGMYRNILRQSIKRIDDFCENSHPAPDNFIMILDENTQRKNLIAQAAQSMYGNVDQCKRLIEPPFHLESHRYQNLQVADWIAGLVGRLGALQADPRAFSENVVFTRYFQSRLKQAARKSGIRKALHG